MSSRPGKPAGPADDSPEEAGETFRIPPLPAQRRVYSLAPWEAVGDEPSPQLPKPTPVAPEEAGKVDDTITEPIEVTEYYDDDVPLVTEAPLLVEPESLGEFEFVEIVEEPAIVLDMSDELSPQENPPAETPPPEPAEPPPPPQQLVLVGAGQTHLLFLKAWRKKPLPNVEVTLITAFDRACLPGMQGVVLAGLAEQSATEIDLVRWCAACQVRLIVDRVNGVNVETQQIQMAHHPNLAFDFASFNLGSVPSNEPLWQARRMLISTKPRPTFLSRFEARFQELLQQNRMAPQPRLQQIAIVGGGATGVELALCLEERINNEDLPCEVRIIEAQAELLSGWLPRTRKKLGKVLHLRGIHVRTHAEVVDYDDQGAARLPLNSGSPVPADLVIWAAGTAPPAVLKGFSLPKSERGFLQVRPTLQTTAEAPIFVVGSALEMAGTLSGKLSASAEQQALLLRENLQRLMSRQPLVAVQPHSQRMRMLACGDGTAFLELGRFSFCGTWCWWWKWFCDRVSIRPFQSSAKTLQQAASPG